MTSLPLIASLLGTLAALSRGHPSPQVAEGCVEFVATDSEAVSTPSGTIRFWTRTGGRWTAIEVAVEEGLFRAELPVASSALLVGRAVLDGREAWCPLGLRRPRGEAQYALSLREVRPTTLMVVDAGGQDVADPEIRIVDAQVRTGDSSWTMVSTPYSIPLWSAPEATPNVPGTWIGEHTYAVRAPGKARATIHIDPRLGGTHVIALEAEARLDITLEGSPIVRDAVYQLVIDDGSIDDRAGTLVFTNEVRTLRFERLRAAQYVITPGPHEPISRPVPDALVAARFTLAAGETRSITLQHGERSSSTEAHGREPGIARELRGMLHVPAAWNATGITIELQRRDPATGSYATRSQAAVVHADPADPEWYRWSAGDVADGMWRAVVRPIPWYGSFELEPGTPRDVQLVIPQPVPITVAVVDGRSDSGIESARVSWHACSSDHAQDVHGVEVAEDGYPGSYSFDATEGDIAVRVEADGYLTAHEHLRVLPRGYGHTHYVVPLLPRARQGIRIVAYEREGAGGLVPASEFRVHAVPVRSTRTVPVSVVSDCVAWVEVDRPGTYDVQLLPSAQFDTPAPVRIDVTSDTAPTIRVRLVRSEK